MMQDYAEDIRVKVSLHGKQFINEINVPPPSTIIKKKRKNCLIKNESLKSVRNNVSQDQYKLKLSI
jgi:hypothetical protein